MSGHQRDQKHSDAMRLCKRFLAIPLAVSCWTSGVSASLAQDPLAALPAIPNSSVTKPALGSAIYDLKNLTHCKVLEESGSIYVSFLVDHFELKEVKVPKIERKQVTRTRIVDVVIDGKTERVEQAYQTSVPVTTTTTTKRWMPTEKKAWKLPLEDVQFFSLEGEKLTSAEAKKRLEGEGVVFLHLGAVEQIPAATKEVQDATKEHCLVATTSVKPPWIEELEKLKEEALKTREANAVPVLEANPDDLFGLPVAPAVAGDAPVFRPQRVERALPAARIRPANVAILPAAPIRAVNGTPRPRFDQSTLVLAKLDGTKSEPKIVCMVDQFREEEREGWVTKFRSEQRERKVTVIVDGEPTVETRTYTVQIPVRERGMQTVRVAAGKKPVMTAWENVRLYHLNGDPVGVDEAREILSTTRPVFLVQGDLDKAPESANSLMQQIGTENTLILVTQEAQFFGRAAEHQHDH